MADKKKKKKLNPRRQPVTMAEVERVKEQTTTIAMRQLCYLFLYILIDKHDASFEDIKQLAEELNYYCESISEKRITWKDVERVVVKEYDVQLPW